MFAGQEGSAACRGEISEVPLCSRKKLINIALIHAKENYCPSGPIEILS